MLNINFVPEEYVQNNESHKLNLIYLVLFGVVMTGLIGFFVSIKLRQRSCDCEEKVLNSKMDRVQQRITQIDQFQAKRKEIMKTALTTTELIEPVPRSVLLALLTNNLPSGVSLLNLKLVQKESNDAPAAPKATSKFQAAKEKQAAVTQEQMSREKLLETQISIEGIAPSDLQVAGYINRLGNSPLLENVAMVESKEFKKADVISRQFKLTANVKKGIHITKEDVIKIREK